MLILSSCMCSYLFQQCVKDCWKLNYFFIHVQQFKTEKVIRHISRSHKVHRQFSIYLIFAILNEYRIDRECIPETDTKI